MCAISARVFALSCALLLFSAHAVAYTVDCNQDYTDCDSELRKITAEDDDSLAVSSQQSMPSVLPTKATSIESTTEIKQPTTENTTEVETVTTANILEATEEMNRVSEPVSAEVKPKPRLLDLNVDELQNFANALHNETNDKDKKPMSDLSDVNLDDEEEETRMVPEHKTKEISHKFYTNLQAPFHPMMTADRASEEVETCKENEVTYKIGDHMDRGCEETCECMLGGIFDCSPRCKHPYIRKGRRLMDPLCFESPVDECCSIIACATGNGDKVVKMDVCRYGNDTHPIGSKWNIDCEQTCSCEPNSVVTCRPRCNPLPVSDKCINVQDPNDACCEVQVCDVSHDVHEEHENSTTSTSTTTEQQIKGFEEYEDHDYQDQARSRPLVLAEPIGSIKVLQNNSVQVNLLHLNNSEDPIHLLLSSNGGKTFQDIELKYSNLILNLEAGKDYILKTRETGTKFNFTMTASDAGFNEVPNEDLGNVTKIGCYQDGQFYPVGEEFHIGCEQLCECTGHDTRECVALVCPSHVGLELVSKGCVRWAPSPPAIPPNCCPRSARCLSDGTCHYKGVAVPNWSEVPIHLTGCEQRCFCENGELDCQEVCSPLSPVPPQHLRCPPNHRPAPVNISDEDCCKTWGCLPNAGKGRVPNIGGILNYVTPLPPIGSTIVPVLQMPPPLTTDPTDFYKHLSPVKSFTKYPKIFPDSPSPKYDYKELTKPSQAGPIHDHNITAYNLDVIDMPHNLKIIYPDLPLSGTHKLSDPIEKAASVYGTHPHTENYNNIISNGIMAGQGMINRKPLFLKGENFRYFLPLDDKQTPTLDNSYPNYHTDISPPEPNTMTENTIPLENLFEPATANRTFEYHVPQVPHSPSNSQSTGRDRSVLRKQVTILKTKDLKNQKPMDINAGIWDEISKMHVLNKLPNPYETVLLRAVPPTLHLGSTKYSPNSKVKLTSKGYTTLDLEHLLNQMERGTVANKNLGRSADKQEGNKEGKPDQDSRPPMSHPAFLPTISPEIHFPRDDIPDYDGNIIHQHPKPSDPALAGLPPGLTLPPQFNDNKKLTVISLQADSPTSVKMLFGLPPVLVGLRGSVDLRYTDKADEDISQWYSQVFAPADEILTTPRLEFRLAGLKPSTSYKIRGKLYLHNLPVEPESEIYTVRTMDLPTVIPLEEKRREIDSRLTVVDMNDTTAQVSWRRFSEQELLYIDGIQVRYRPVGTPIYSMTELLHHSRSAADLHDLRPGTKYEAALVLVPPPKSTTELVDPANVEFVTKPYVDPYNWTVTIETRSVGAGAAEVWWRGVPAPAERWVRVYRAAHACNPPGGTEKHEHDIPGHHGHEMDIHGHDHDRHERDAFRLAARDLPPAITISGLLPDTKCRIWLEMFLTNGKVKTSNVLEINTKSLDNPEPIDNEIPSSSASSRHGDYYGALVGVGAVAAMGALSSLLLLLVVIRRHRPRSVPITSVPTAPRESSLPPYDNPAYKLELQQETMDL